MASIIWQKSLLPGDLGEVAVQDWRAAVYANDFVLKNAKVFSQASQDLPVPDPRIARSTSRQGMLLSATCATANDALAPFLASDPYSVGIYCAVENGTADYDSIKRIQGTEPEKFAETYKKNRNPKMYLKQLPNLAAAQLGIMLGVRGPMNVYNHSRMGALQALEQAEQDLELGIVKAALVCSASSITEDPLLAMRTRRRLLPEQIIAEGAGAVVLVKGAATDWRREDLGDKASQQHGIAQHIVTLARRNLA